MIRMLAVLLAQAASPTSGIQEAIDALGGKGGVVRIPAGRHVLKAAIRVPSGVTLQGAGATLVKCDGVSTPLARPAKSGDRSVTVKDATGFEPGMELALARLNEGYEPGDMDAWGFDWVHPRITAVKGAVLELDRELDDAFAADTTIVLNFFPAVAVERAKDVVLDSLRIEGNLAKQPGPYSEFQAAAVALLLSTNVTIRDCVVREWPCDGISVQGGRDVTVSGNTVEGVRGHGFHPGSGVTHARFLKNRSVGNLWDGLYFCQAVKETVVEDNLLLNNGRHGIGGLGGGKDEKTRDAFNTVLRNVCEGNAQAGIEIQVSRGHKVSGNVCRNNSRARAGAWPGISIRDATGLEVADNICTDDGAPKRQSHGIVEQGASSSNVFRDNRVEGNLGEGLLRKSGK